MSGPKIKQQPLRLHRVLEFERAATNTLMYLRVRWDTKDASAPSDAPFITLILDDDDIVALVQNLLEIKEDA